jgi:hypothetical protein
LTLTASHFVISALRRSFSSSGVQQRVGAVLIGTSTFYNRRMEQIAALAARHALPAIFPFREYTLAGGLMSYGSSIDNASHQVSGHKGRRSWMMRALRKLDSPYAPTG